MVVRHLFMGTLDEWCLSQTGHDYGEMPNFKAGPPDLHHSNDDLGVIQDNVLHPKSEIKQILIESLGRRRPFSPLIFKQPMLLNEIIFLFFFFNEL